MGHGLTLSQSCGNKILSLRPLVIKQNITLKEIVIEKVLKFKNKSKVKLIKTAMFNHNKRRSHKIQK